LNPSAPTRPLHTASNAAANRSVRSASVPGGTVSPVSVEPRRRPKSLIQHVTPSLRVTSYGRSSTTTTPRDCSAGSTDDSVARRPAR
jgi:hypothetical protein